MLKQTDKALSYLVTGLGIVFLMLTPIYAGSFISRGGVEYMGAVLFMVFLGLLNVARIKSGHRSARTVALLGNMMALVYLVFASIVTQDPAAIGISVLMIGLCCTSYLYRANESCKTPTPAQQTGCSEPGDGALVGDRGSVSPGR